VPLGTIVKNENGTILVDITTDGQSLIVAKGGSGGRGNKSFVSAINRAPYYADKGCPGEEKIIILELKLIADIGIIGFPNAGKSTFLSVITKARPKIYAYPFTTLDPNLGVYVGKKNENIIFADMPGLIEGAHIGTGLGIKFLKHMERTGIFLHFIDTSIDISMIERYKQVRFELLKYSDVLSHKKEIIVATKMDIADCNVLNDFEKFLKQENLIESFFKISSYNNTGIDELLKYIEDIFERVA
jgi:GTP-binding protein